MYENNNRRILNSSVILLNLAQNNVQHSLPDRIITMIRCFDTYKVINNKHF